jgi:hypothetical protein
MTAVMAMEIMIVVYMVPNIIGITATATGTGTMMIDLSIESSRDATDCASKFFPKLCERSFSRFKFSAELAGVDCGFAIGANHNIFFKPT